MGENKRSFVKRCVAWLLTIAMVATNLEIVPAAETVPEGAIEIATAEDLAKIGADANYPMTGDYVLTADIDLSDREWTPIGGYMGTKGTMDATEANVFSGTFDGQGHVIYGLTMDLDGSIARTDVYGQVGLFSVIAGSSAEDYAVVENLIFKDVNIKTDFSDGLAAVGTLAGDVNGYSQIDQVVVWDGNLNINPSGLCDTVGVGGLIGECRTGDSTVGNRNISITNCFNGATIVARGTLDIIYAGGIIGRVAKSECKEISHCVNVAEVSFNGYSGYGITSGEREESDYLSTLTDSYFIDTFELTALSNEVAISEAGLTAGVLPGSFSPDIWTAKEGCYVVPSICYASSISEAIYLSGLSLDFADGESSKEFTTTLTLPSELEGIGLAWTSSNETALSIVDNVATANTDKIGTDITVELTVTTESGFSKIFRVTVISSIQKKAVFDSGYAKVGEALTVSVENPGEGENFTYAWTVGGVSIDNETNSYTPTEDDLESFITVTVTGTEEASYWELSTYLSELPVIYLDTADGTSIDSNTLYEDAYIKLQGNDEFSNSKNWYEGVTEVKGRGNSTWSESVAMGVKRPYKLKLDSKANAYGLGTEKNKHWVLLANMIDHTNMRNELVNGFAKEMGLNAVAGTNVALILNGEYVGIYEFCEHRRVDKGRVDIFEWEGLAGDIAEAIANADVTVDEDSLATAMEQNYSWLDGTFSYGGKTYTIADYYTDEIPEFTGGFMLDMDFRIADNPAKYISSFYSTNNIPLFVDSPEYAKTNNKMMSYIKNYMNAYEAALRSENHTTKYNGETVHYTDLFDLDSLVAYWLIVEYTNNWDSMKNSTFLHKDLEGPAKMGPVWDYDWAFGNINMYSMIGPFVYDNWHTTLTQTGGAFCEKTYQGYQWNHYLVKDPYFVTKAYEAYNAYRPTLIEDMIKDGGKIDTLEAKYQTAADANDARWSYSYSRYKGNVFDENGNVQYGVYSQKYNDAVTSMKMFMKKRVEWFDKQFTSVENLYASLGNSVSGNVSIEADTTQAGTNTIAVKVDNANAASIEVIVNGKAVSDAEGTIIALDDNNEAQVMVSDKLLETKEGANNTVQVLALNANGAYISGEMNFMNFTKKVIPTVTGTVTIEGTAKAGEILKANLSDYKTTENLSFQWYADDEAIEGATKERYLLEEAQVGKVITVKVTSTVEEGELVSKETEKVAPADVLEIGEEKLGLLINHVYGGGAAGDTPISHDFIELYNNSTQDIVLDGYKVGYMSNRDGKDGSTLGKIVETELAGTIKSGESFLIRCAENETKTYEDSVLLPYVVSEYDLTWDRVIDNKQFQVILYNAEGKVLDGVSVGESTSNTNISKMVRLDAGTVSKQKSLRREGFGNFYAITWYDSDEEVVMITSDDKLNSVRPHTTVDGTWAGIPDEDPGEEPEVEPAVTIAGTAKVGEVLTAVATDFAGNLSYQWYADAKAISGAVRAKYVVTEDVLGKVIFVTVTSDADERATSATTTAVAKADELEVGTVQTGLIINQIYGGGAAGDTPISHDFIELYNNSNEDIVLDGITVGYLSNRKKDKEGSTEGAIVKLALSGTLGAKKSYLIRGAANETATAETAGYEDTTLLPYEVDNYDAEWTGRVIDNKQYQVIVYDADGTVLDAVSMGEEDTVNPEITDMVRLSAETVSKQMTLRRHAFGNFYGMTWYNSTEKVVMLLTQEQLEAIEPHSMADGYWAGEPESNLLLDLDFNTAADTYVDDMATAELLGGYSIEKKEGNDSALRLNGRDAYVNVTATEGGSLLAGKNAITISYDTYTTTGATNWSFYAAPTAGTQTYLGEVYVGALHNAGTLTVERYRNSGSRPTSISGFAATGAWEHVDIVISEAVTSLYVNGVLQDTVSSNYMLTDILQDSVSTVIYLGKANWTAGEYYNGLLDNYKIYDADLSEEEVCRYYLDYALERAGLLIETEYIADTWAVLEAAVEDAKEYIKSKDVENATLRSMANSILNSIEFLEYDEAAILAAAREKLNAAITKIEEIIAAKGEAAYVSESLRAVRAEIAAAKAVLTSGVTEEDFVVAQEFLEEAFAQIEYAKILNLDFDDGLKEGIIAYGDYTLEEKNASDKALYLNGTNAYLDVKAADGGSLLAGKDEITISYDAKVYSEDCGWVFFAAEDDREQILNFEKYLGVLHNLGSITVEKYNNTGIRPATAAIVRNNSEWTHVDVVISNEETKVFVNGMQMAAAPSTYALSDIIGEEGILQIGKANWYTWVDGEYYKGLLDNISIYDGAITVKQIYKENIATLLKNASGYEEEKYTEDSWSTFAATVEYATGVYEDAASTELTFYWAIQDLYNAMAALVVTDEFEKNDAAEALAEEIMEVKRALADAVAEDYLVTTWNALQEALTTAEETLANDESSVEELTAVTEVLKSAFENLEYYILLDLDFNEEATDNVFYGQAFKASANGSYALEEKADGDKVLVLDGTNGYLDVKAADGTSLLGGKESITISYDAKADGESDNWILYAAQDKYTQVKNSGTYLAVAHNASDLQVKEVSYRYINAPYSILTMEPGWNHVDIVFNGTETRIYINYAYAFSVTNNYALTELIGDKGVLYIGKANYVTNEFYNGAIDNLKIYNEALTELDICGGALREVVAQAKELDKALYTQVTWAAVERNLASAEEVLANEVSTTQEIFEVETALKAAIRALVTLEEEAARAVALEAILAKIAEVEEKLAGSEETEYTEESWSAVEEALDAAKIVAEEADASSIKISNANTVLIKAFEALKTKAQVAEEAAKAEAVIAITEKVEAAEEQLSGLEEADYTEESWKAVTDAIAAAKETAESESSLSTEVTAAQRALETALAGLKTKAQAAEEAAKAEAVTAITAKVEAAEEQLSGLEEADYTEESWKAVTDAIAAAKETAGSESSLSTEVTAAQRALETALAGLKTKAQVAEEAAKAEAVTAITAKVEAAEEQLSGLVEADYTEESWKAVTNAIAAAKETAESESSLSTEVTAAQRALETALAGLKTKAQAAEEAAKAEAVTAITAKISAVKAQLAGLTEADYTEESWDAVEEALAEAEEVAESETSLSGEVTAAQSVLEEAVSKLKTKAQVAEEQLVEAYTKELSELIAAEKKWMQEEDSTEYTAVSWKAYLSAITAAEKVLSKTGVTSKELEAAITALEEASDKLEIEETLVSKIILSAQTFKIAAGKKLTLNPTVLPADADNPELEWKSSNNKFATVQDGVVSVKKAGVGKTVTITATAMDGSEVTAKVKIKIMKAAVKKITLKGAKTVKAGKTVKIKTVIKLSGKGTANKKLEWTSSNEAWATVKNGKVKTKKAGKGKTVTIKATSTDGSNKTAKIKIRIK